MKFTLKNDSSIYFNRVILETGEYFDIKVLVLHRNGTKPILIPKGKVAGQKEIKSTFANKVQEEESFWEKSFSGGLFVQIVRLLGYILILFASLLLTMLVMTRIIEPYFKKKSIEKSENQINEFKKSPSYEYNNMNDAIFNFYKSENSFMLYPMSKFVKDEKTLNEVYKKVIEREEEMKSTFPEGLDFGRGDDPRHLLRKMESTGLIIRVIRM